MKHSGFPKNRRLLSNRQFKAVLNRNRRATDNLLTLFVAENDFSYPRLGVSVGKSCGKAVVRNHVKRLVREAFRQNQDRIPHGFDYVLMIAPSFLRKLKRADHRETALAALTLRRIQKSFLSLAKVVFAAPAQGTKRTDSRKESNGDGDRHETGAPGQP